MQNFVENMGGSDIQISSNIGNVIELGDEDLGNDFGASMLSNTRVTSRPANQGSSQSVSALEPLQDIGIGSLEPLEAISFDIPSSSSPAFPDISVTKSSDEYSGFSNSQTASGPSINLAAVTRLSPEEERKKKSELLNKLNRLESKGYTLTKRFTMDNSLDEIQQEYDRLVDAKNLEASLRFQRQCMMGVVTGAEFLNSKFNPFDWELDGWSESVHENIEDFDEIFEELYDKYRGRGNMPPEAKLMMSLVGSGFMFHMSNSFFKSKMSNMDPSDIFRNNPQLAKQFAQAAAQQAGPGFGNFMGAAMGMPQGMPQGMSQMQQQMAQQMPAGMGTGMFNQASNGMGAPPMQTPQNMAAFSGPPPQRREMKGPSGVDDILKTFQEVRNAEIDINPISIPPQEPSYYQQPARQAAVEISSIHTTPISDVGSDATRTGSTGQRASRGKRKPQAPSGNTMTLNL
jgi:hypothetical protein